MSLTQVPPALSLQDYDEVLNPPQPLAQATGQLVTALVPSGNLNVAQLDTLVQAIVAHPELWQPLTMQATDRRRYRLLYEDDRIDVWVLSWMPGQGTGFHDHEISGVGLAVAQGMIVERQMLLPSGATRLELRVGDTRQGPPGYIHSVAWGEGAPAVSIHAYSPPLMKVGQYKVNEDGILWRSSESGRKVLLDHSIASVDPSRSDG
jgi:predicted metal-dependent enzyme (double-stranded beta helix superfamily)